MEAIYILVLQSCCFHEQQGCIVAGISKLSLVNMKHLYHKDTSLQNPSSPTYDKDETASGWLWGWACPFKTRITGFANKIGSFSTVSISEKLIEATALQLQTYFNLKFNKDFAQIVRINLYLLWSIYDEYS